MPGLSFLAKKSWHTSNLKNVEKVWLAEQKADQEQKKLSELQKQLEEERQIQELRQLQAASGQNIKHLDTSMDWMYEGPAAAHASRQQQMSEEYLLGKIYKPQESKTFDLTIPAVQGNRDASWMAKVSSKNDTFTRMHEDPFIMIKQEEKKKRDALINNPIKMEKIRASLSKELEGYEQEKELRKRAKKELKKRLKKEKKEKKKNKKAQRADDSRRDQGRDRDDSSSSSSSDSDGTHSRSPTRRVEPLSQRPAQSSSGAPSVSRAPERDADRDRPRGQGYSRDRIRSDSRERQPERRRDQADRRAEGDAGRDRPRRDSRSRSRDTRWRDRSRSRDADVRAGEAQGEPRYGLIAKGGRRASAAEEVDRSRLGLGPRPDLLKKKEDDRAAAHAAKMQAAQRTDAVKRMTEDERMRRVAEMEHDAQRVDQSKTRLLEARPVDEDVESGGGRAVFLADMRTEVYQRTRDSDIASRIHERRYNRQSSAEVDDAESFLKKA